MQYDNCKYKNITISKKLLPFIKYMDPVENNREILHDLSNNWNTLSLLSQLGDAGVNMSEIKNNFSSLSSELINHLALELLDKSINEMNFKAQVTIDLLIRNLFERTADIGFFATDEDVRNFLINHNLKYTANYQDDFKNMKSRFLEYINKYSVYSNIVLMNTHGDILATLDDDLKISKSQDSIIKEVFTTSKEYVETFKYHDFLPSNQKSLVYSYKVTQDNNLDSKAIGVLSLCFKFQDEMDEIFKNLIDKNKKEAITLLDREGYVIATSDKYQIPLDAKLEIILDDKFKIVTFGGRDYIAKSRKTNGYQGFYGLGWYGHIMVPIDHAFQEIQNSNFKMEEDLLLSILQNGRQFNKALKNIPIQANNIQKNLNRAIWNGNIQQGNGTSQNKQFSRTLMQEIRQTGENTKNIIGSSIANLTETIILGDSVFYADLIVDIMDRNLYERANDCRWWALTSEFRKILDKEEFLSSDTKRMSDILQYINGLYTVYTNLIVYDKYGVIKAVSNQDESHLINKKFNESWINRCLELSDSSKYCVSDFTNTTLYNSDSTYIYNATIRSLDDQKVLGGIGIVFDSKIQFKNMIEEALPKNSDGSTKDGVFATIATKEMMIISSSYEKHEIGSYLDLDSSYFTLNPGESTSEIIVYEGKYYALGVKCSKGYREYKSTQDEYINNIYAFFFSFISDVSDTIINKEDVLKPQKEITFNKDANAVDIATFMIGKQWFGIETKDVVEAISVDDLKSTIKIDPNHHFKGTLIYQDKVVMVIDIKKFLQENIMDEYKEIIIIKYGTPQTYLGILVNGLEDISEININNIKTLNNEIIGEGTLIESVIFPDDNSSSKDVLSILSVDKIVKNLVRSEETRLIYKMVS